MIISDPLLIDTNVLVYAHNQDSPFHKQSLSLVKAAIAGEFRGVLAEQNLVEFYSIVTDKSRIKNGRVFDAHLAATMLSHQIKHIVTANVKDFKSFTEIKVLNIEDC